MLMVYILLHRFHFGKKLKEKKGSFPDLHCMSQVIRALSMKSDRRRYRPSIIIKSEREGD